jgi:hypothetical protein
LKIWNRFSAFYIIFDDERVYNNWLKGIEEYLKSDLCETKCEHYGSIYDLSVTDPGNKMWLDIKLTAVKPDLSSISENFFFDMSQADLYSSVKEVLCSIEGHLDKVNNFIFKEFLFDIVRSNYFNKAFNDIITTDSFNQLEFLQEKNQAYKHYYKSLRKTDLQTSITDLLRKNQTDYDNIGNAFKILELQKLSLQDQMREFFSRKKNEEKAIDIEKNLEIVLRRKELSNNTDKRSCCTGKSEISDCLIF